MKNLLFFLLGALIVGLTAFTPQGRQIFLLEPVQPTTTVILRETWASESLDKQAVKFLKQGYIVRLIGVGEANSTPIGYMVLEKY